MLKRIVYIAFFTGFGQLLSIFVLKYLARNGTPEQLQSIGQLDSLMQLMINTIALGLQSAAMRNLALREEWKEELIQIQSARMAGAVIMLTLAAGYFINPMYLFFIAAPIFGWNADYALYARGYAVTGSIIAFIRLFVPFSLMAFMVIYHPEWLIPAYVLSMLIVYIATNIYIAGLLKIPVWTSPRFSQLWLYLTSLPLGIVILSAYFMGLGLMLVIPYFYVEATVAIAFIGLKFYMIFKGVIRIIHQAFIKEMTRDDVCLKVDQLTTIIGFTWLVFMCCFPNTFIGIFFGEKYQEHRYYFILLSASAFVFSMFASLTIKSILEKKDKQIAWISVSAVLITVISCFVAAAFLQEPTAIALSLMVGEIVFAVAMIILMNRRGLVWSRILFFLKILPAALIPLAGIWLTRDSMTGFVISLLLFGLILGILHFKKFTTPIEQH